MKYIWANIPEEIVVYKFLQTDIVIDGSDQTQLHPMAKIDSALTTCTEDFNLKIGKIG